MRPVFFRLFICLIYRMKFQPSTNPLLPCSALTVMKGYGETLEGWAQQTAPPRSARRSQNCRFIGGILSVMTQAIFLAQTIIWKKLKQRWAKPYSHCCNMKLSLSCLAEDMKLHGAIFRELKKDILTTTLASSIWMPIWTCGRF